jgi:DNA damage-binding protein 1
LPDRVSVQATIQGERQSHPSHGFVDGDLIKSFLDLDREGMELVVRAMNQDSRWDVEDVDILVNTKPSYKSNPIDLEVDDVLAMVEEILMLHLGNSKGMFLTASQFVCLA